MNVSRMYPYVVPEVYFSLDFLPEEVLVGLPPTPEGFRIPLGHGLFAILVEDENGTIRSLDAIDLEESGLTSTAAHALALQNLQAFAKANRESKSFEQSGFEGPEQFPVISWLGHWLVASCCRLPGLYDWASKQLAAPEICVCIPIRDAMFIFPKGSPSFRSSLRQFVAKFCEGREDMISTDWFALTASGIAPFIETHD